METIQIKFDLADFGQFISNKSKALCIENNGYKKYVNKFDDICNQIENDDFPTEEKYIPLLKIIIEDIEKYWKDVKKIKSCETKNVYLIEIKCSFTTETRAGTGYRKYVFYLDENCMLKCDKKGSERFYDIPIFFDPSKRKYTKYMI